MKLKEIASTIRSKNAGVDLISFDIFFVSAEAYALAKASPSLTREAMAELLRVTPDRIYTHFWFDGPRVLKFTLRRERPSGSPGEYDVFGAQQYAPLLDAEVRVPVAGAVQA